jgi:hypothetical protein
MKIDTRVVSLSSDLPHADDRRGLLAGVLSVVSVAVLAAVVHQSPSPI